ncbi:ABC transporter permease [Macrococcus hajekii]|uniref:ABC transporter permease n=1 Tax=Macrococcus hajekii TaxID=198482 RepID=A0A4R6BJQ0_9STAP|nr:ABC transporter permease [Macrococcus hajekii]TDM01781.1 ABC transporter permease [Macrococcus hajekii]GGB07381.1 peptide ABC transporter permease [Macrococcus hajekii]
MVFIKKILSLVVTMWLIVTITFIIMHSIPGDPFSNDSKALSADQLQNMKAKFHLDEPLIVQYFIYLKNIATFNLGPSIQSESRDVNTIIGEGLGASALLGVQSIVVALLGGIILGTLAAIYKQRIPDFISLFIAIIGISVPSFILAPLLIKYLGVEWHLLPIANFDSWLHSVNPTIALAVGPLAIITRYVRSNMIEVLNSNYIRTAKAKGLPMSYIITQHALRNTLLPVITFLGPLFAAVVTGTFVVEKVFSIPGIGKYFVESIFNRDYPVIMGTTIFYSFVLLITLLLVDVSYRLIDPRISLKSGERFE